MVIMMVILLAVFIPKSSSDSDPVTTVSTMSTLPTTTMISSTSSQATVPTTTVAPGSMLFSFIQCFQNQSQWVEHLPVTQAAGVRTQTWPNIFCAPILLGAPAVCTLSQWESNTRNRWLVTGEIKERNHKKNPFRAICEANTDKKCFQNLKLSLTRNIWHFPSKSFCLLFQL